MRSCVSTPGISVLVNGSLSREFGVERGLRKGDPLSPFLFNMAVDGLSALFRKAAELDLVKGVVLGSEGVHVSTLQFADDTILFIQLKVKYIKNARHTLRCFELASGLKINFHKSCVVKVGKIRGVMTNWGELFGCPNVSFPIVYLGLPLGGSPSSKSFWMDLIQRVENRLAPRKKTFLNKGGRLVLIKTMLSSIPTFYMSVFKLLMWVAHKLERLQRNIF
ncbi:hypothetical protein Dsin_021212 [Dipteronia sinensis]|uniref:Reverse transcriptase domain-containing protein n=1 Tax=Dipteronia sinensis TaxID=43782 RepID=A0AAE0A092_9ROSI|nr:hypothetical protein Dsin_021212 [Dipteronia sinensis]